MVGPTLPSPLSRYAGIPLPYWIGVRYVLDDLLFYLADLSVIHNATVTESRRYTFPILRGGHPRHAAEDSVEKAEVVKSNGMGYRQNFVVCMG